MEWMNQIGSILQNYSGGGQDVNGDGVIDDYDRVAQQAPPDVLSQGLAAAFRSNQTPDFGNMVGQLFSNGNSQQRAGLLNMLLPILGPMVLQKVMGGGSSSSSSLGGGGNPLSSIIGMISGGGQVTPEMAEQVSEEDVKRIAAEAEKHDPSVIDQISGFYSEHPTLVKSLGAAALAIALSRMSQRS